MKPLYRTTKVIYDGCTRRYEVWYRNWFVWHYDSCYKPDKYIDQHKAKQLAIEHAQGMLGTVEVWRQSSWNGKVV